MKIFLLLFTIMLWTITIIPSIAFGQSAKDAIRALKKLEARVEAGISYKDYAPALGDAKFEVNLFLESPEAKEMPRLSEAVKKTMGHYLTANTVWQYKFIGNGVTHSLPKASALEIAKAYPATRRYITSSRYAQSDGKLDIDTAISAIWKEASEELKKATNLLSQTTEPLPSKESISAKPQRKKSQTNRTKPDKKQDREVQYPLMEKESE